MASLTFPVKAETESSQAPLSLASSTGKKYQLLFPVGHGAHGDVFEAQSPGGTHYALKVHKAGAHFFEESVKEASYLKNLLKAPHTLQIHDSFVAPPDEVQKIYSIGSVRHVIVTEMLCNYNSLDMLLLAQRTMSLKALQDSCQQILEALSAYELQGLLHLDLKPENIVMDLKSREWKIVDFGGAAKISEVSQKGLVQTRFYRAPERLLFKPYSPDLNPDIWSLGCTLFEWYTGGVLFYSEGDDRNLQAISGHFLVILQQLGAKVLLNYFSDVLDSIRPIIATIDSEGYELIAPNEETLKCIVKYMRDYPGDEPIWKQRISAAAKAKGEDPSKVIELIEPMLQLEGRITAAEAYAKIKNTNLS